MALASLDESAVGLTWVIDEPMERASHALVDGGRVWLIDPTDEREAVERALSLGEPAAVLQLLDRHGRACAALAARLGVPHKRVPRDLPGTPFEVMPVVSNPLWHEVALWWPALGALVVAEAVGTARLFAPGPAGAGVHIGLRLLPPRKLARYAPTHLLVGHGPPIHGPAAAAALHEALERSRRDLPHAAVKVVRASAAARR
jgi:hypothetical protein